MDVGPPPCALSSSRLLSAQQLGGAAERNHPAEKDWWPGSSSSPRLAPSVGGPAASWSWVSSPRLPPRGSLPPLPRTPAGPSPLLASCRATVLARKGTLHFLITDPWRISGGLRAAEDRSGLHVTVEFLIIADCPREIASHGDSNSTLEGVERRSLRDIFSLPPENPLSSQFRTCQPSGMV